MKFEDELTQLTEKLSQLHDSLNLDGILLQPQLPPMGRLFEKGNDYARRYGIETIAMVCALRHLGCSLKGIQRTMKATGEQAPSLPTISAMVYADKYKKLREQPQALDCLRRIPSNLSPDPAACQYCAISSESGVMGWLRKGLMQTWAALVALFLRPVDVQSTPVEVAPVVAPVEVAPAPAAQPLDYPAPTAGINPDLDTSPGSPLKALIDQLEKAFPAPSIKPGSDMASLQYAAGQRAVVEWVRMKQKRGQA